MYQITNLSRESLAVKATGTTVPRSFDHQLAYSLAVVRDHGSKQINEIPAIFRLQFCDQSSINERQPPVVRSVLLKDDIAGMQIRVNEVIVEYHLQNSVQA